MSSNTGKLGHECTITSPDCFVVNTCADNAQADETHADKTALCAAQGDGAEAEGTGGNQT